MAKCSICGREMLTAKTCVASQVHINGKVYDRIRSAARSITAALPWCVPPSNTRLPEVKLPLKAPATSSTNDVGAGPLAAGPHSTSSVRPVRVAKNADGASGTPEQGPGKVRMTAFDGALLPARFTARTANV